MPALRYSEDTEFNDALRDRGILPPLPSQVQLSRSPSPQTQTPQDSLNQLDTKTEIDQLELDDQIPTSLIDSWKSNRLDQLKKNQKLLDNQTPGIKPIGRQDYIREVNQASQIDIDSTITLKGKGTGVVLCLWNNSPASIHILSLLQQLAHRYPVTRFLKIPGTSCIDNYPDINQPTIICYRRGACIRQYVGIGSSLTSTIRSNGRLGAGLSTTISDIEAELLDIGILDDHLKLKPSSPTSTDDDEDYDPSNSNLGRERKPRLKETIYTNKTTNNDSGSDLDI